MELWGVGGRGRGGGFTMAFIFSCFITFHGVSGSATEIRCNLCQVCWRYAMWRTDGRAFSMFIHVVINSFTIKTG